MLGVVLKFLLRYVEPEAAAAALSSVMRAGASAFKDVASRTPNTTPWGEADDLLASKVSAVVEDLCKRLQA